MILRSSKPPLWPHVLHCGSAIEIASVRPARMKVTLGAVTSFIDSARPTLSLGRSSDPTSPRSVGGGGNPRGRSQGPGLVEHLSEEDAVRDDLGAERLALPLPHSEAGLNAPRAAAVPLARSAPTSQVTRLAPMADAVRLGALDLGPAPATLAVVPLAAWASRRSRGLRCLLDRTHRPPLFPRQAWHQFIAAFAPRLWTTLVTSSAC
jgi:hypothetical protein